MASPGSANAMTVHTTQISTETNTNIFERLQQEKLSDFDALFKRRIISAEELNTIRSTKSIDDVVQVLQNHMGNQNVSILFKITECSAEWMVEKLRSFSTVLDVVAQGSLMSSCLWGGVKAILLVINDVRDSRTAVKKQLNRLLSELATVGSYKEYFDRDQYFHERLRPYFEIFYRGSLEWTLQALTLLGYGRFRYFKLLLASALRQQTYHDVTKEIFEEINWAKREILGHASLFTMRHSEKHTNALTKLVQHRERHFEDPAHNSEPSGSNFNEPTIWNFSTIPGIQLRENFVGREDEVSLIGINLETNKRTAVCGPPGIGKSQLVYQFVDKQSAQYQLVHWINCSTSESFDNGLITLFKGLKYPHPETDHEIISYRLRRSLGETKVPWILILDDCTSHTFQQIISLVPPRSGHVIFISRDKQLAIKLLNGCRSSCIHLKLLSMQDSIQLLLGSQEIQSDTEPALIAQEIYRRHVGGLPLGLSVVASNIREPYGSTQYRRALELLESTADRHWMLQDETTRESVPRTIKLALHSLKPATQCLFIIMCFLCIHSLPQSLLLPRIQPRKRKIPLVVTESESHVEWAPCTSKADTEGEISNLVRAGLVECYQAAEVLMYEIHQLTASLTREMMVHIDSGKQAIELALEITNDTFPNPSEGQVPRAEWQRADQMVDQLSAAVSYAQEHKVYPEQVAKLLAKKSYHLYFWRGDFVALTKTIMSALESLESSADRPSNIELDLTMLLVRSRSHTFIGDLLENLEFTTFLAPILAQFSEMYQERQAAIATLNAFMGRHLQYINLESRQYLEIAWSQHCKLFGQKDVRTLRVQCDLARLEIESKNTNEGLKIMKSIGKKLTDSGYAYDYSTAAVFYTLGQLYESCGNFQEMELCARKALEIEKQICSPGHCFILWSASLVLSSLAERQLWDDMAKFLREEQFTMDVRPIQTHYWAKILELAWSDISNLRLKLRGTKELILLVDNLTQRWRDSQSNFLHQLSDRRYDAAVSADSGEWESALPKVIQIFSDSAALLGREHTKSLVYNEDIVQGFLHYCLKQAAEAGESQQDSVRRFSNLWNNSWDEIDKLECGLTIDLNFSEVALSDVRIPENIEPLRPTFLISVVWEGNLLGTELVLQRKPNIDQQDAAGNTALFYAAKLQHFAIILLLLRHEEKTLRYYFRRTSVLHLICCPPQQTTRESNITRLNCVKTLLKRGIDENFKDKDGKTALEIARASGLDDVVGEIEGFVNRRRRPWEWQN